MSDDKSPRKDAPPEAERPKSEPRGIETPDPAPVPPPDKYRYTDWASI